MTMNNTTIEPGRLCYRDGSRGVALLRDDIFYLLAGSDHPHVTRTDCLLMVSHTQGDPFARIADDGELTVLQRLEYSAMRQWTDDEDGLNDLNALVSQSVTEIRRLRLALDRVGFYCAGVQQNVADFCLKVLNNPEFKP